MIYGTKLSKHFLAILLVCLVASFRSQKIQYLLFRTISGVGGYRQHVYDGDAGQEAHDQEGLRDSGEPRQVELLIDICDTSL